MTLSGASKVLTNQICDANGKNCKNVSQLYTGNGTVTVTNTNNALQWNTLVTVAKVGGTEIKVKLPANPDTNTRNANSKTADGYVTKGNGQANKVRKTDASGNPAWRDDDTGGSTYTLPQATNSVLGGVKLGSDTKQNVAANAVSSTANRTYAIQTNSAGQLVVNVPRTGQLNGTTSNSLRELAQVTNVGMTTPNKVLKPKNLTTEMYIASDIRHDGGIKIQALGTHEYYRKNSVMIHPQGVSIGDLANRTSGLGVHGPITVGKYMLSDEEKNTNQREGGQCTATPTQNTISIYATGNSVGAGEHFEIIGTPRILIGVKDGGYMYFDTKSQENRIGINKQNPQATLDINGSIRIGKCGNSTTCTKDNVGEIRYYEKSNKGYFVGCRRKSNGNANTNFERVILSDGTETTGSVANDCTTPVVPYDPSSYQDQGVLAQEQPACK